jgi:hypothetical protein
MLQKYEICVFVLSLIKQRVSLMTFAGFVTLVLCYFFMTYVTSWEIDLDVIVDLLDILISEEYSN